MRHPLFLLLTPALVLAQGQPQPRIHFDSLHHDFGKIGGDTKVTHRFRVSNTGKAYLNITRLNPSCGCTSTVLGKWSLAPGESTEIEVTFNPAGFHGLNRKSIQVVSDDPATGTQTLTFEAEVVREISASTESIFFQDVVRSVPRKASVKLSSANGQPVQVSEVKTEAKWLSSVTRPEGNDVWLDFTLDASKATPDKRSSTDTITVATRNPRVPSLSITVQWELRPAVSASPARVAWVEPAGTERVSTLTLTQVDNRPFRIKAWKTSNPSVLSVHADSKQAAAKHTIQVVLSGQAKPGSYLEKVHLTLDDPDQPELEIRVSASLR